MMVVLVLSFMSCCDSTKSKKTKVGDIISFGAYEWRVLDIRDDHALIITKDIIMQKRFDSDSSIWVNSEIRAYLNDDFYNSFTSENRVRIRETQLKIVGQEYTLDNVFLLSIQEAVEYFENNDTARKALFNSSAAWWWLRSPFHSHHVYYVSSKGTLCLEWHDNPVHYDDGGVRPALWLKL